MTPPTPSLPWAHHLRWMLGTLTLCIATAGAINAFIDPLGLFGSPRIPGLNATKPYLDHHRELARWQAARRLCPNAAIFGNSRAEIGFDPEHPAFGERGLSAFNHAIPGSSISTALNQFSWLRSAGCIPRTVIIGVEFYDALGTTRAEPLPHSPSAPRIDGAVIAETVFSVAGLRDSLKTMALQRRKHAATLTDRGFNPLDNYIEEVSSSGHYILFRQRAEENWRNWSRKTKAIRPTKGESIDQQALEALLTGIQSTGGKALLVIYPYHAQIRLMQEQLGLGELFSDWKRMIVSAAARHADVEVWDFSSISTETLEAIPRPGDRNTHLRYFWEAGHFKRALGDKIIARMLDHPASNTGFGLRLTPEKLEGALAEDRARVRALLNSPSPLLNDVSDIAQSNK